MENKKSTNLTPEFTRFINGTYYRDQFNGHKGVKIKKSVISDYKEDETLPTLHAGEE